MPNNNLCTVIAGRNNLLERQKKKKEKQEVSIVVRLSLKKWIDVQRMNQECGHKWKRANVSKDIYGISGRRKDIL